MPLDLKGKKVVFTGFRDSDLSSRVTHAGGRVMSAVSAQTDILVVEGSKGESSTKAMKAKQLGVQVMMKDAFIRALDSEKKGLLANLFGNVEYENPKGPMIPKTHPADKLKKKTEYLTHDNGSRPFKVIVSNSEFSILKRRQLTKREWQRDDWDEISDSLLYDVVVVKPSKYIRVFVGKDPGYGKKFDGNSLLFQLTKKRYMFVGSTIFTIEVDEDIIGYLSPVYGSDVHYPYAVGTKNTYMFLENTYFPNEMLTEDDPYSQLYCFHLKDIGIRQKNKLMHAHQRKYKIKKQIVEKRFELW